jgi:hypothetical protein
VAPAAPVGPVGAMKLAPLIESKNAIAAAATAALS